MKVYAQIANQQTKQVNIGTGTNVDFYKALGFVEMDVEQAYDGAWYVTGYAPVQPIEEKLAQIQKELTDAVQQFMDETAQTRGYDNIHTACSYTNSTDPIFNREGNACLAWRDSVWRKCYTMLDEFKAGTRQIPTVEELLAELPVLDWGDDEPVAV